MCPELGDAIAEWLTEHTDVRWLIYSMRAELDEMSPRSDTRLIHIEAHVAGREPRVSLLLSQIKPGLPTIVDGLVRDLPNGLLELGYSWPNWNRYNLGFIQAQGRIIGDATTYQAQRLDVLLAKLLKRDAELINQDMDKIINSLGRLPNGEDIEGLRARFRSTP